MPRQPRRAPEPVFPSEDGASASTARGYPQLLPTWNPQQRQQTNQSVDGEEEQFDIDQEAGDSEGVGDDEITGEDEELPDELGDYDEEDADAAERYISPPIPPNLREISSLASWTVSTYKPGSGVAALRHPSPNQFWQSDGPQPHILTLHFFKRVSIVRIRIYLDFELDESYTPTKVVFLAGMGGNDLVEFATWQGESPHGWVDVNLKGVGGRHEKPRRHMEKKHQPERRREAHANINSTRRYMRMGDNGPEEVPTAKVMEYEDIYIVQEGDDPNMDHSLRDYLHKDSMTFAEQDDKNRGWELRAYENYLLDNDPSAGNVLKAMVVQARICENHQNGKDTHVRGFQVFARDDKYYARMGRGEVSRKSPHGNAPSISKAGDLANGMQQPDAGTTEYAPRFEEEDWLMEPELR
ncbi:anaphase promoting complex subunit doc1 [Myotisia sp. PD_48]|nr:anaphase promoting complex subunit doc1 [Myotisia sp. PD_48]